MTRDEYERLLDSVPALERRRLLRGEWIIIDEQFHLDAEAFKRIVRETNREIMHQEAQRAWAAGRATVWSGPRQRCWLLPVIDEEVESAPPDNSPSLSGQSIVSGREPGLSPRYMKDDGRE
jgi:hypothetical protein